MYNLNMLKFKKLTVYAAIIIVIMMGFMGCTSLTNPIEENDNIDSGLSYRSIYKYKTKYVGDASKVSNLVNSLYYSEHKQDISLKTDSEPYEVTVNYLVESRESTDSGVVKITDKMLKNAAIIFSLIDNVDNISFTFKHKGEIYTFPFQRELFNKIFEEDIRNYSTSFDRFRNQFIPKLERENWNEVIDNAITINGESGGTGTFDFDKTISDSFSRKVLNYRDMIALFEDNGYESGAILESNSKQTKLLLYHNSIESENQLKSKKITLNDQGETINEEYVYLSEKLKGYSLEFKEYNFRDKKYLLGYRYLADTDKKKLYSDLLVVNKENLSQITILSSYEQEYDASKGIVPQGPIPTVVDFTIELVDDYIIYEDTDIFWKVQDVRTKEVYSSGENNPNLTEIEPNYNIVDEYIYVLRYTKDNSVLAFNTKTKKFEILEP